MHNVHMMNSIVIKKKFSFRSGVDTCTQYISSVTPTAKEL